MGTNKAKGEEGRRFVEETDKTGSRKEGERWNGIVGGGCR